MLTTSPPPPHDDTVEVAAAHLWRILLYIEGTDDKLGQKPADDAAFRLMVMRLLTRRHEVADEADDGEVTWKKPPPQ